MEEQFNISSYDLMLLCQPPNYMWYLYIREQHFLKIFMLTL